MPEWKLLALLARRQAWERKGYVSQLGMVMWLGPNLLRPSMCFNRETTGAFLLTGLSHRKKRLRAQLGWEGQGGAGGQSLTTDFMFSSSLCRKVQGMPLGVTDILVGEVSPLRPPLGVSHLPP